MQSDEPPEPRDRRWSALPWWSKARHGRRTFCVHDDSGSERQRASLKPDFHNGKEYLLSTIISWKSEGLRASGGVHLSWAPFPDMWGVVSMHMLICREAVPGLSEMPNLVVWCPHRISTSPGSGRWSPQVSPTKQHNAAYGGTAAGMPLLAPISLYADRGADAVDSPGYSRQRQTFC